jgi:adhesin/invasin
MRKISIFLLLGVFLAVVVSGCGGGGGSATPPPATATQFALSTSKQNVLSNGSDSAQVTANFTSAANGTVVTFSTDNSAAVIDKTAQTSNGKATAAVKATNLDAPVVVTATSGTITKTITITFNSAISANAAAPTVAPNTPATIDIATSVSDPSRLVVTTSPTAGVTTPTATGTGQFTATVTPQTLGPVNVTVSVAGTANSSTTSVTAVMPIALSVSPAGPVLADGISKATVTASFPGITVASGEVVDFTASNGAVLSSPTASVDANGNATVTVSSSTPGTSLVTASYKGSSGSASIVFEKPAFSLSPAKPIGLADNADTITITATFTGTAPADGTAINFSVTPATAVLGNATATTTKGVATTTLKSSVPGVFTVTAGSASTTVKFITQPTAMGVSIALNPAVTGLASLQFSLVNSPGATFTAGTESAVNGAAGSLIVANPTAGDTTVIGLISGKGFNTGTAPIITASYGVASGLPTVQVSPSGISAANATFQPIAVKPENFVITVKYNTDTF